jgi:hypothetical protein
MSDESNIVIVPEFGAEALPPLSDGDLVEISSGLNPQPSEPACKSMARELIQLRALNDQRKRIIVSLFAQSDRWRGLCGVAIVALDKARVDEFSAGGSERTPSQLDRIESVQKSILEEIHKMADDQTVLDAEITAVGAQIASLGTALQTSLTDLLAKIASDPTAPVADFTSEVTLLQGFAAQLSSLQASAVADDPGAPAAAFTPAASTPAAS